MPYNKSVFLVGVAGFEPTTPCSQSRCANRTALHPEDFLEVLFGKAMQRYGFLFIYANVSNTFLLPQPTFSLVYHKKNVIRSATG